MDIIFNALFKIDITTNSVTRLPQVTTQNDLSGYITELITNILESSDKKGFKYRSETTEVRNCLEEILSYERDNSDGYEQMSEAIAQRLLNKEKAVQEKIRNLGKGILKGIVVISLVTFQDHSIKIIISKADHDEFIDSASFSRRSGLPLRKKIFKAFIAEYTELFVVKRISIYDTNSSFAVYWWRDFLELEEVYTDDYNTQRAFNVIDSKILAPLKKSYKADYINLWNATIHFFRSKEEFALDEYNENVIKNYRPFSDYLIISDLEKKVASLPEKYEFDGKFKVIHKLIKKRFKNSIQLTPQIELHLKEDIQDISKTIRAHEEQDGTKWVMIKSDEGFQHFQSPTIEP